MALPIVLNSLDLQALTPKNARTEAKRGQLRLLNEAMDVCHQLYTGTMAANNIIKKTIQAACSEHDIAPFSESNPTTLPPPDTNINDWFDVFVSKPTQYLRISFKIDISFCTGRYSDTEDNLPRCLALSHCLIPPPPTPTSFVRIVEDRLEHSDWFGEADLLEPTTDSHLGFLDFSKVQCSRGAEGALWDGQMVDEILDKVLSEGGRF